MLLSFTVGNFRSFAEKKTLSMEPASIKDFPQNVVHRTPYKFLSSAVIYGANASGKSNLLHAMRIMKQIIVENFGKQSISELPYDPFLLDITHSTAPTFFEVVFLIGTIKYRYGFEVDSKMVHTEWLFETKKKAEKPLFLRVPNGIEVMAGFPEGKDFEERTRDNALFLSVVDQFNGHISGLIMEWFWSFDIISGIKEDTHLTSYQGIGIPISLLQNNPNTLWGDVLNQYFSNLDLGFERIEVLETETTLRLVTMHKVFDEKQQAISEVAFNTRAQESAGTNKIIDLSGAIFSTLYNGGVLVIDELDAKLHPLLTKSIIQLFQNKEININGAQLIFATHDTNILSICELRRDQVYFVEKNEMGESDLYSLVEYKSEGTVRKDRSFEKDYIGGRYGAIPFLGDFTTLSDKWHTK